MYWRVLEGVIYRVRKYCKCPECKAAVRIDVLISQMSEHVCIIHWFIYEMFLLLSVWDTAGVLFTSQGPDSLIIGDVGWSEIYLQVYQCQIRWRLELLLSYKSTINTQLRCNFVAEKQTPPTTPLLTKPTSKTRSANSSSSIKFLNEHSCCRPCGSVSATRVLRNAKYVAL